jgi:biopolymer transport protein ExbB/TolQ
MSLYQFSKRIDKHYNEMTPNKKASIFIGVIVLFLLLLSIIGWVIYSKHRQYAEVERYIKELEESKQNYYLQTIANSNLEKKLQEMSLRLAETINNTVELERMLNELDAENVSLEEIRRALETGLRRTKTQLDNMQGSVNSLINQREKTLIYTEQQIIHEKSNTHGKY